MLHVDWKANLVVTLVVALICNLLTNLLLSLKPGPFELEMRPLNMRPLDASTFLWLYWLCLFMVTVLSIRFVVGWMAQVLQFWTAKYIKCYIWGFTTYRMLAELQTSRRQILSKALLLSDVYLKLDESQSTLRASSIIVTKPAYACFKVAASTLAISSSSVKCKQGIINV